MIKTMPADPEPTSALSLNVKMSPRPFPSSPLIVMSVFSCFLATAAFVSSCTQIDMPWAYFIVPGIIGFLATVPYHVHLYNSAQEHHRSSTHSDPIFITPIWIIYGFLLVPLWAVIFFINILFCDGTRAPGVIVATIWSGMEWIVLLFIAMRCAREIRQAETSDALIAENQSGTTQGPDGINPADSPMMQKPQSVYFMSFAFSTLTLVFGIGISVVCLVNIITFFLTAPHHIALYISNLRPRAPPTFLSHSTRVLCAFSLAALWFGSFILDILVSPFLFQNILLGIFGGIECIITAYLAVRTVLDSFAERQIKL